MTDFIRVDGIRGWQVVRYANAYLFVYKYKDGRYWRSGNQYRIPIGLARLILKTEFLEG